MSEMAVVFGKASKTITKIQKNGWTLKDAPGEFRMIHKSLIHVHEDYQREFNERKAIEIAVSWSWIACGVVTIGERDGKFWAIEGQHRVGAAKLRADISTLPCMVFQTDSVEQEARGFLDANVGRKPVNSFAKFRASVAAKDETSAIVGALFDELGITPCNSAKNPKQIKCLAWSMRKAREDFDSFEIVVRLADKLCVDSAISEILLDGLSYIHAYCDKDLNDKRLRERIMRAGSENLVNAAKRASAFFTRGGAKVWADGMIIEINKGLREKFVLAAPELGKKSS